MQLYQLLLLAFASIKQSKASAFKLKLSCLACLFQRFSKGTLDCTQSVKPQGCQSVWLGYINQCEFISSTLVHSGNNKTSTKKENCFAGGGSKPLRLPSSLLITFGFHLGPADSMTCWYLQPCQVAQVVQLLQDGASVGAVARMFAVSQEYGQNTRRCARAPFILFLLT